MYPILRATMCLTIEGDYVSHDWRAATYIMIEGD